MHVKRFRCDFLPSIQLMSVTCHEYKGKISTFYFLFVHCP